MWGSRFKSSISDKDFEREAGFHCVILCSEHFQTREIVNIGFLVNSKKCLILYSRGQGNFINDQITNPCISCHCQLNTIKQIFTQQLFCWCVPLSMQMVSPLFYCPTSCYATLLFTETHQLMQYKRDDILRH